MNNNLLTTKIMHTALQFLSPWLRRYRQSGLSWRYAPQSAPSDTPSWSLPWWCAASMHASGTRSSECVCRCLDPQSASSGSPCNAGSPAPSDRCMPASSPWRWWCPAPHASLSEQVASCCLACCQDKSPGENPLCPAAPARTPKSRQPVFP